MPTETPTRRTDTADRILDVAERLVQVRGFNGFSYADVARELGITKASLHYHFPGKGELGEALITRYGSRFAQALAEIDDDAGDARAKLTAYVAIYRTVLLEGRMCLCGILAAEYETLPARMRDAVTRFFELNEAWLAGMLEVGQGDGSLTVTGITPGRLGDDPQRSRGGDAHRPAPTEIRRDSRQLPIASCDTSLLVPGRRHTSGRQPSSAAGDGHPGASRRRTSAPSRGRCGGPGGATGISTRPSAPVRRDARPR